jgi:hypothetical protein
MDEGTSRPSAFAVLRLITRSKLIGLDHHRNRGQQKIVVQHTTVNADQAVVATGNATDPALLTASVEKPLRISTAEANRRGMNIQWQIAACKLCMEFCEEFMPMREM